MMKTIAIHIASLRPVFSQKMNDSIQPEKQPKLYMLTMMPSRLGFGCPNCRSRQHCHWPDKSSRLGYRIEEVFVAYDTAKHSLVVAKEDESLLRVSHSLNILLFSGSVRVEDGQAHLIYDGRTMLGPQNKKSSSTFRKDGTRILPFGMPP